MKSKNYINNKKFEETIKNYLASKAGKKKFEGELVEQFDMLITNIINGFNFHVDKDDAKQECFLLVFRTIKKFKPDKGAAFNYFTTIIVNNLKLLFTKNRKLTEKQEQYLEDVYKVPKNSKIRGT